MVKRRDFDTLKKTMSCTLYVVALCNLCLAVCTGTVGAYEEGYIAENYTGTVSILDGNWTTPDEWADAYQVNIDGGNAIFRLKYDIPSTFDVHRFSIEINFVPYAPM